MPLYPLRFAPRFVEKIWGGRKFQTILGKNPPSGQIGESWEIYDFPPGVVENSDDWVSSVVAEGSLAGKTLHDLILAYGDELCGKVPLVNGKQFPILIKFLDAREDLSVQVHPDQRYCNRHPEANLKTEAWYVMQHEPGARILKDLMPGVTREVFERAITDGSVEKFVRSVAVKDGDCYFLPSGTIHALGAGILVAEVQTPSDTTFRVYDFQRVDPSTGKQRALHVQQALETIDFTAQPAAPQPRQHTASMHTTVSRLCTCEFFTMEKVRFAAGVEQEIPQGAPAVWMMIEGEAEVGVATERAPISLRRGDTVLMPATMTEPSLRTKTGCVWIEVTFPEHG